MSDRIDETQVHLDDLATVIGGNTTDELRQIFPGHVPLALSALMFVHRALVSLHRRVRALEKKA